MKPRLIVEIGSWKGDSAVYWASLLKQNGIDGAVICVDTWLGGLEHISGWARGTAWDMSKFVKHGHPVGLYHQFLANVMHEGLADYIVPLANTSAIGARWLAAKGLAPQLVYVDGSHEEEDVYDDLVAYWGLMPVGGIMCGDDWSLDWPGVIAAVTRFARERQVRVQAAPGSWAMQKTLSPEMQQVIAMMRAEKPK